MRRSMILALVGFCVATSLVPSHALSQETMGSEKAHHPRIAHAIQALEGAIAYMEAAPHDFGGHKAAAIHDSRQALEQLRLALQFRERRDNQRGR